MPLKFKDHQEYGPDPRMGLCGGWDEICVTPAGNYVLNFVDYTQKAPSFLLQFRCKNIGEFTDEPSAKASAQDHFNALVKKCQDLTTS